MTDYSSLGYWVRRFLQEHLVHERNFSRNTQQSYRDTFRLFVPFAAHARKIAVDRLAIEDISPELVLGFLSHLEDARACSVVTRNQRLATIRAFTRFVGERSPEHLAWCSEVRLVSFKRHDLNPRQYLEKEEMNALLAAPDRKTKQGQRDYAILLFLYNSGARASEAIQITVEDLVLDSAGTGTVKLHGKGRKIRYCPLWKGTMAELRPLVRNRRDPDALFLNRYGKPLTRFGVYTLVERYAKLAAKIEPNLAKKRVSPHTIRHTTATHLLRAGVDINTIRSWLGHVSLGTTNIYAETDLKTKARALAACDPGANLKVRRTRWRDDPGLMDFLRAL